MSMSRSESRQEEKRRRSRRLRRLLAVNLVMLVIIGALAVVYYTQTSRDEGPAQREDAAARQADERREPEPGQQKDAGSGGSSAPAAEDQSSKGEAGSGAGSAQNGGAGAADEGDASGEGKDGVTGAPGNAGNTGSPGSGGAGGSTIRLAFVGDLLLAGSVEKLMEKNGYAYPYAKTLEQLQQPDLLAGNMETPITERGTPADNKQFVFKGSPKALPALKEAGFDVINLANNHTLDQGVAGLFDTIDSLNKAGIPNIGAGRDEAEAYKPVLLEAGGISVAYIGVTHVVPEGSWKAGPDKPGLADTYDTRRAVQAIAEAKKLADLVVVFVHWGVERADQPNELQKRDAMAFIDAGADLVVGSHPHVLQGFENYKGKWISYSLGNYIFNMTKTPHTDETGVLDAVCTKEGACRLQFHPMRSIASQPAPLEGEQAQALLKRLEGLSFNAAIDANGYVTAKE